MTPVLNTRFYQDIFELSTDLIWQCDHEGCFTYLNPKWQETLGYSTSELLGKRFSDIQEPNQVSINSLSTILSKYETFILSKDGSVKTLVLEAKPILDIQGNSLGHCGIARDVTQQKSNNQPLDDAEKKFLALFEKGPIGVAFHKMVYDQKGKAIDYLFLDANQSYQKLTGVDPRGKLVTEAFPGIENDPFDWIGTFGKVAKTGLEIRFEQYLQSNERWYDCVGYQYKPDHFVAAFIEITDRKRSELALADRNRFVESLLDVVPGILYIYDIEQQRNVFSNEGITRILGYSVSEIQAMGNQVIPLLMHPDDLNHYLKVIFPKYSKAADGEQIINQYRMRNSQGQWQWIESTEIIYKRISNGTPTQIFGVALDVTTRKFAEDAAIEMKDILFQFIRNAPIYTFVKEVTPKESRVLIASSNYVNMVGISGEEMTGKTMHDLFPTDLADSMTSDDWKVASNNENLIIHEELNGNSYTTFKFPIHRGDKALLAGYTIDMTERKKAEELLLAKEKHQRELLRNLLVGVVAHSTDTSILYHNEMACNILGLSPDQMVGKKAVDPQWHFIREDGSPLPLDEYPIMLVLSTQKELCNYVIGVHKANNHVTWALVNGAPIYDGQQVMQSAIINFSDITELRLAEKRIKSLFLAMTEMVALFELIFNEQGIAINYKVLDCNHAFTKFFGIVKEETIGKLATEIFHITEPQYLDEFLAVVKTGAPFEFNAFWGISNQYFSVSAVSTGLNQFATISTDVTAIHLAQEALSNKNKELEHFLYVASHDLRSPLVNIQGFSRQMQEQLEEISRIVSQITVPEAIKNEYEQLVNDEIPQSLKFIVSGTTKMNALINGLLQISRTGKMELEIKQIQMNALIENIVTDNKFQISQHQASIAIGDLPDCKGDENLLNQLFSNLINNAIKYRSPERTLQIQISGKVQKDRICYSVQDNGIGIEDRHLGKIWDVFYRIDPKTSEHGEGLGLTIIQKISEKHRGKVWVESVAGKGSTFFFELPN